MNCVKKIFNWKDNKIFIHNIIMIHIIKNYMDQNEVFYYSFLWETILIVIKNVTDKIKSDTTILKGLVIFLIIIRYYNFSNFSKSFIFYFILYINIYILYSLLFR